MQTSSVALPSSRSLKNAIRALSEGTPKNRICCLAIDCKCAECNANVECGHSQGVNLITLASPQSVWNTILTFFGNPLWYPGMVSGQLDGNKNFACGYFWKSNCLQVPWNRLKACRHKIRTWSMDTPREALSWSQSV